MNTEQQAKLLEEIAAVMRERPEDWWREFECQLLTGRWLPLENASDGFACLGERAVRRRPRTITIAGIEIPEPLRNAPKEGTWVYVVDLVGSVPSWRHVWGETILSKRLLSRGLLHSTEEAAQQHARALILASGGEVE